MNPNIRNSSRLNDSRISSLGSANTTPGLKDSVSQSGSINGRSIGIMGFFKNLFAGKYNIWATISHKISSLFNNLPRSSTVADHNVVARESNLSKEDEAAIHQFREAMNPDREGQTVFDFYQAAETCFKEVTGGKVAFEGLSKEEKSAHYVRGEIAEGMKKNCAKHLIKKLQGVQTRALNPSYQQAIGKMITVLEEQYPDIISHDQDVISERLTDALRPTDAATPQQQSSLRHVEEFLGPQGATGGGKFVKEYIERKEKFIKNLEEGRLRKGMVSEQQKQDLVKGAEEQIKALRNF